MDKEKEPRAKVWAYVGHNRGVARDLDGNTHRNEWVELNLKLGADEVIEKLSWRAPDNKENANGQKYGGWGANNIIVRRQDLDDIVGQLLTFCDAMFTEKEQKDAWKHLIRSTIHKWHDNKMYQYMLEDQLKKADQ